jgi:hypothetical protein
MDIVISTTCTRLCTRAPSKKARSPFFSTLFADGNFILVPLVSRGIENNTASVHAGFLLAYNSVRRAVLRIVGSQLDEFPGYGVISTGMQ